jgi:hypothetical protein
MQPGRRLRAKKGHGTIVVILIENLRGGQSTVTRAEASSRVCSDLHDHFLSASGVTM